MPIYNLNESKTYVDKKKYYDAIVFDFGNVLEKRDKEYIYKYYDQYINSDDISVEEFKNIIKGYHIFAYNKYGSFNSGRNIDLLYKNTLDKKYYKYYNHVLICIKNMVSLYDYTIPMLRSLKDKGYKLYYLTNKSKWNWENHGGKENIEPIMKYFDDGIVSCDVGVEKPDIRIYEMLIEKTSLNPETTLFFDDKEINVGAAEKVGINGVVFTQDAVKDIMNLPSIKNESYIKESKDKSEYSSSFRKKTGGSFRYIKFPSSEAEKYMKDDNHWNKESIDFFKKAKVGELVIDKEKDIIAGYVFVNKSKRVLGPLRVYDEYRGYGLSNTLVKDTIDEFGARELGVYTDNQVAIHLYRKYGFEDAKKRKKYKDGDEVMFMKLNESYIRESKDKGNNISYSKSFDDVKNIVNSLSKKDIKKICHGEFLNSPYIIYREVLLIDKEPVSFIDVYKLPNMEEDGTIVIATKQNWRNLGYSTILINRMKDKLKHKNLTWKTQKNNKSSIYLAKKMKYIPITESYIKESNNILIKKSYGINIDGKYNAIVEIDGESARMRGRSELLIINNNMIYLSKSKKGLCGNYDVPGGGWNEGEDHSKSAIREAQEEARLKSKNVNYAGYYTVIYDQPHEWIRNKVDPKYQWRGYYTEVFIGEYAGRYNGKIDDIDKDELIDTGKFYPIEEVYDELHPIHQKAIDEYLSKNESYYRVTYNGKGIYNEFKKSISFEEWKDFKNSDACKWLPIPPDYANNTSYFTDLGFKNFEKYTLPIIKKSLNNDKIKIDKIDVTDNIVYRDKYQIVTESYIEEISRENINSKFLEKNDTAVNLENWNRNKYNILFITGLSGSGKTTLAIDLRKEFNCYRVELDSICVPFFERARNKPGRVEKAYEELDEECPGVSNWCRNNYDKYSIVKWNECIPLTTDFLDWFISTHEGDGNLYIINGAQIPNILEPSFFEERPIIVKESNTLKSIIRRTGRESGHEETLKKALQQFVRNLKTVTKKSYRDAGKEMRNYAKSIRTKSYSNINLENCILEVSSMDRKYKCPYCSKSFKRKDMSNHIEDKHEDLIPKEMTPLQITFNTVNHKDGGKCTECGGDAPWNEDKGRYDRICNKKSCHDSYVKTMKSRMIKVYGREHNLNDAQVQTKMLSNRKISGTYIWSDGTKFSYCGSYEKSLLEFLDKVMKCKSEDIITPGPIIDYYFEGEKHQWITDLYYIPYNLCFDVKDGGNNPNNRPMEEYRSKQDAKELAIKEQGKYNYIRLTDNNFAQLFTIFMELKMNFDDRIIRINEECSATINAIPPISHEKGNYIVQYSMKNTFTKGYGYCTDDELLNDIDIIDIYGNKKTLKRDEFLGMVDEYTLFRYTGDIVSESNKDYNTYPIDYFYTKLTGKRLIDDKQILVDSNFKRELNLEEKLDIFKDICKESIKSEPINESIGFDENGVYLSNNGLRTKSYESLEKINKDEIKMIGL